MTLKIINRLPLAQLSTNFVVVLLDYLHNKESVDTEKFLSGINLDEVSLLKQNSMSPMSTFLRLVEAAAIYINDPNLGLHYYADFDFRQVGALGYAVLNSETLGHAFMIRSRYHSLLQSDAEISITTDNKNVHLSYQTTAKDQPYNRQDSEMVLMSFVSLTRQLVDKTWQPAEAHFQHPPPADISEHKRLLCSTLYFSQTASKIVFDKAILDSPIANSDVMLSRSLTDMMDQLLKLNQLSSENEWLKSLQSQIIDSLCDGVPGIDTLAARLGLSSRTLQRKLFQAGTNFNYLVENIRYQLAINYLSGSRLPLQDIVFLLGYADMSSFDRAFKRWTGCSPLTYRKPYQPGH